MLKFRARRESGHPYLTRLEYLDVKTGNVPGKRWLCQAIAQVNQPLSGDDSNQNKGGDPSDEDKRAPQILDKEEEPTRGFPWVTLVLGSGSLEPRDPSTIATIQRLPDAIALLLADRLVLPDDTSPAQLASAFATSLIKDRLGVSVESRFDQGPTSIPEHAAELILLTALLTRFFHQTKAMVADAPSRWNDDVAELPVRPQESSELLTAIVNPARLLLTQLLGLLNDADGGFEKAVHSLLQKIDESLGIPTNLQPALHSVDLRGLTECAWYALTRDAAVYPGWSDLLVDLSMYGGYLPSPDVGRPRPVFDSLDFAPDLIEDRYVAVTEASWFALNDPTVENTATLYDHAAAVVRAQANLRSPLQPAHRPPIASVFVTTFDLELEMSLWAQPGALPFVLAVPIYVFQGGLDEENRSASLCWLGAVINPDHDIDPSDQLQKLRNPSEWIVLSNMTNFDRQYGHLPVVVRLSGCPLIQLPTLGDIPSQQISPTSLKEVVGEETRRGGSSRPIAIDHAVLLDEYAAMQHTAVDNMRYGIPEEITGVKTKVTYSRFWMVMGVQMGDSSVRYRVTSQIASPLAAVAVGESPRRPLRSGVVVNRRLDLNEQDLLYWYGFDVVKVPCQQFSDDLAHYVQHLENPNARTVEKRPCPLP